MAGCECFNDDENVNSYSLWEAGDLHVCFYVS